MIPPPPDPSPGEVASLPIAAPPGPPSPGAPRAEWVEFLAEAVLTRLLREEAATSEARGEAR
ncbi:hypothetical protein L6R50_06850 [Myxococcota bacterium]|nr:hypothetical protein [Myxococcota bacterium]